jgi:flagellar hook-length control protein FliK
MPDGTAAAFPTDAPLQTQAPHEGPLPPTQAAPREALPANTVRIDTVARRDERMDALPANSQQAPASTTQPMPNELRPIVQQQLDAAATQRLLWHGEAWPNQPLEWEIIREDENNAATAEEAPASWRTSLRLDTPRLGHIEASLHLTGSGITMRIAAVDDASAADLHQALPELAASLEAAGIKLLSAQVRHGGE